LPGFDEDHGPALMVVLGTAIFNDPPFEFFKTDDVEVRAELCIFHPAFQSTLEKTNQRVLRWRKPVGFMHV
jgi:hypothetical protein